MAGYSVTYTVVDQATAQIDRINKRIQQLRAPLEAQAKSMTKFVDVSGLRRVENGLKGIASGAMSAANSLGRMVPALGAITGATTLAGIGKLVTDFSHMALELTKTGMVLDETPEKLSGVAQAMRSVGGDAQTAIDALTELKNTAYDAAIGLNGTAAYAFQRAGIALRQGFNGPLRDTLDIQADVLRHLDDIPDSMDRQREAMRLGGKSLADMYLQYKALGVSTEEFIRRERTMQTLTAQRTRDMLKFEESMATLNTAFYSLGATVAGVVAPVLTPMLNDLSKWVEAHQTDIAAAIKGIADALVWLGNNMDTVKTAAEVVAGVFVTLWGVKAASSVLTLIGQVKALDTALSAGLMGKLSVFLAAGAGAYDLGRDVVKGKPELPKGETDYSKWLDLGFLGHKLYNAVTGNSDTDQEGKTIPIPPAPAAEPTPAEGPAPAARPALAAGPSGIALPKGTRDDPLYVVAIGGAGGGGAGGASYGGGGFGGGGGGGGGAAAGTPAGGGGAGGGRPSGRFGGMAPGAGTAAPGGAVPPGAEQLIKASEGLNLRRYNDVGHPAIGYGHDITPQEMAQGYIQTAGGNVPIGSGQITKDQAEQIFQQDYQSRVAQIGKMAPGFEKLNANQQGAITSYYYNTGRLPRGLKENLASGNTGAIAESLRTGIATAGGQFLPALGARRQNEANLFNAPVTSTSAAQGPAAGMTPTPAAGGGKVLPGGRGSGGVNAALDETMRAAWGAVLPKGWTAKMTAGQEGGHAPNSQHHGGNAEDWQIFDQDGKPVSNRGADVSGLYQKAAVAGLAYMSQKYPDLAQRFAWGGHFETSSGSGTPDLMHYDIGGARGRFGDPHAERKMLAAAGGAEKYLASLNAPTGGVDISVTHKNAPANVELAATKYGTGLNLAAPRVEHQRMGQI